MKLPLFIKKISIITVSLLVTFYGYGYHIAKDGKNVVVMNKTTVDMIDSIEMQEGESLTHNQILKIVNSKNDSLSTESL